MTDELTMQSAPAEPNADTSAEVADDGEITGGQRQESEAEPYRVFHSKAEWQDQIDKIIGQRLSKMRQLQKELDAYKEKEAAAPDLAVTQREKTEKLVRDWDKQAEAIQGFDKQKAGKNPDFVARLKKGYSVSDAYLLSNLPSLIEGAEKRAMRAQADRLRARSMRPGENGMGTPAAGIGRPNVGRMSNREFDLLLKEIENGRIIN